MQVTQATVRLGIHSRLLCVDVHTCLQHQTIDRRLRPRVCCSGVYSMPYSNQKPYLAYLGGQKYGTSFVCPQVLDVGADGFDCFYIGCSHHYF